MRLLVHLPLAHSRGPRVPTLLWFNTTIAWMATQSAFSYQQIAAHFSIKPSTARARVKCLMQKGMVRRLPLGMFAINKESSP
jgi:DeoR/GlpR family transcriptional regulator of sugar metabolism